MNRERAETYLRQLAEAELRRARTLPAARIPGRQNTARLALVAHALVAVSTVDVGTAIRSGPTSSMPSLSASPARKTRPGRVSAGCRRTRGSGWPG